MIIDTEKLDKRALALKLLKRSGMDWIDTPADELWEAVSQEDRQQKSAWREGLIADKIRELNTLITTLEDILAE